jgi:hypothetical protein
LAGLLWEKYQESIIMKLGFEKVQSWECLYVHREKQVFLSAYVDDYKMAGKKKNISPMWAALKGEGLEPPVPLRSNIYLGCQQREVHPDLKLVSEKREMFTRLCFGGGSGKPDFTAGGDLLRDKSDDDLRPAPKPKNKKKKMAHFPKKHPILSATRAR